MAEAWKLEEDEEELRQLGRRHRRVALGSAAGEREGAASRSVASFRLSLARSPCLDSCRGQGGIGGAAPRPGGLAPGQPCSAQVHPSLRRVPVGRPQSLILLRADHSHAVV